MAKVLKIGLLGIGKMGRNHLKNLLLLKDIEVSFIYDVNEEILAATAKEFGVPVSRDLEEDLKKSDGVLIVTPTFTHFHYINLVAKTCNNIFVEKPLTDTLDRTQTIEKIAKKRNLNIQVGFIERYNPAISTLKELLRDQRIINIDFSRTNKMSSRITDVDVIMDLMIHDIDLALLLNGEVDKIIAQGVVVGDMVEYARALITHKNGAFSNIVASRLTEKRIRHIAVTAYDFYIDCNLLSKEILVSKQTIEQYLSNVSISSKTESIEVRPKDALLSELIDFIGMIRGQRGENSPNEDAGLRAMEVAYEIQKMIWDTHNQNKITN